MVIALSPLCSHLNSLLVKKACFPLEIIRWNIDIDISLH